MTQEQSSSGKLTPTQLRAQAGRRRVAASFVQNAKAKHGHKYSYPAVPEELSHKDWVVVVCPEHGPFRVRVNHHLVRGQGCPHCTQATTAQTLVQRNSAAARQRWDSFLAEHSARVRLAAPLPTVLHGRTKVQLECLAHPGHVYSVGLTQARTYRHLGCALCKAAASSLRNTKPLAQVVQDFEAVHSGKYDYTKTQYVRNRDKVVITCPKHGDFMQLPVRHLYGDGCPTCGYSRSKPEEAMAEHFTAWGVRFRSSDRVAISPKELDFYFPDQRLAVEYCGLYWHSEHHRPDRYHLEKLQLCRQRGIRLIQIFSDEWAQRPKVVLSVLKQALGINQDRVLYARQLRVQRVAPAQARAFLDENHLQGADTAAVYFGLYDGEQLVSLASFNKPSISGGNRKHDWNLSRFVVLRDTRVTGGFSRLLKAFVREFQPRSLLTYADARWSEGGVYLKNGFTLTHHTCPNYWYCQPNVEVRRHRFGFRKSLLSTKIPGYDGNLTERENMRRAGWFRVYDAGNLAFERTFSS